MLRGKESLSVWVPGEALPMLEWPFDRFFQFLNLNLNIT